ncbi:phosphonate metabolism transcriptional regulator PhnF [Acuticoccus sediminis]|uniref:phosphonate metabolism transcriptional regulator PhnF n=1 Tax=Acuticoccus sediminis TaxID=2184697 RepID=UPI001CFD9480|nr:phosphonate metabolism transcriptional regulator PhnF [Acuticoccus sediminis]
MAKLARGQWQAVEEALAKDIAGGAFGDTMQLPTEAAMMERFGVGRHSVRRAVAELERRGLVDVRHGKGVFVRTGRLDYRLSNRTRFSQNLLGQGREPSGQALREEEINVPGHVAEALRLPPGERVYHIVRRGLADDEVVNYSNAYYPVRRFPGLNEARRAGRGTTAVLAEYGVADYIRLRTDLVVRMPSAEEARQLDQPRTVPVIVTKKVDVDMRGVPISYSETAWASERVQFSIDNTAELLDALAAAGTAEASEPPAAPSGPRVRVPRES